MKIMRYLLFSVLCICQALGLNAQADKENIQKSAAGIFEAIRTDNKELFLRLMETPYDIKVITCRERELDTNRLKPEFLFSMDSLAHAVDIELRANYQKEYNRIRTNAAKLKINWAGVVLDSVEVKLAGKTAWGNAFDTYIYFRQNDNSRFYKMHLFNLHKTASGYGLGAPFSPYVNDGPRNRLLTQNLKAEFMKLCEEDDRKRAKILPSYKIDCYPCHCELQYNSITDQSDGVARLKKQIEFYKTHPFPYRQPFGK